MLHILTIALRSLYMIGFAIWNSQILTMFSAFQKRIKFVYQLRFPSFSFLAKKTLYIICASKQWNFYLKSSFLITLEEWIVDDFKQIYFGMMNYDKEFLKTVKQTNNILGTLWFIGGAITNLQKSRCKDGNTKLGWKFFLKPKSNNTGKTVTE